MTRHDCDHPEITLGISLAPNGKDHGAILQMEDKVDAFTAATKDGPKLDKNDAWLSLTTRIMKENDRAKGEIKPFPESTRAIRNRTRSG